MLAIVIGDKMDSYGRVMSRRGLRSGCRSRHFTLSDLAEAKGNVEENVCILFFNYVFVIFY